MLLTASASFRASEEEAINIFGLIEMVIILQ